MSDRIEREGDDDVDGDDDLGSYDGDEKWNILRWCGLVTKKYDCVMTRLQYRHRCDVWDYWKRSCGDSLYQIDSDL